MSNSRSINSSDYSFLPDLVSSSDTDRSRSTCGRDDRDIANSQFSGLSMSYLSDSEKNNLRDSIPSDVFDNPQKDFENIKVSMPTSTCKDNIPLSPQQVSELCCAANETHPRLPLPGQQHNRVVRSSHNQINSLFDNQSERAVGINLICGHLEGITFQQPSPSLTIPVISTITGQPPSLLTQPSFSPPPLLQPPSSTQSTLLTIQQPPPLPSLSVIEQPPPPLPLTPKKVKTKPNRKQLSEIPLPSSIEDINLSDYNIKDDEYTKEEIYNYIELSHEKVMCNECKLMKKKTDMFGKPDGSYFICIPCSIGKINKSELKDKYDWEIREKTPSNKRYPDIRFKRCTRMAHYKPCWSFLERNKQKGKDKNIVQKNKFALKTEKQCLYCRNFKKRQNMIKKMKREGESYESVAKEYYDELENIDEDDDEDDDDDDKYEEEDDE